MSRCFVKESPVYECHECGRNFTQHSNLRDHYASLERNGVCPSSKVFANFTKFWSARPGQMLGKCHWHLFIDYNFLALNMNNPLSWQWCQTVYLHIAKVYHSISPYNFGIIYIFLSVDVLERLKTRLLRKNLYWLMVPMRWGNKAK